MREQLRLLIQEHEAWLMRRVCDYAIERGFSKFTATQEQVWRTSIAGLSGAMVGTLDRNASLELNAEEDYSQDPAAAFGIVEAVKHRERGVSLPMFLGLFKYYRQTYLDLVETVRWPLEHVYQAFLWLNRFFDRVELGLCSEWVKKSNTGLIEELQRSNKQMTNEKNEFLTIFDSLACPVALCDDSGSATRLNQAWIDAFGNGDSLAWLHTELRDFADSGQKRSEINKVVEALGRESTFSVALSRMLDISEKFSGTLIVLKDITEQQDYQNALKKQKELAESYLDVASVIMIALDELGRVTLINKLGCEVLGYSAADLIGKNWFNHFIPQRERASVKNVFATIMADRVDKVEYHENSIIAHDGSEREIAWHNSVLRDDQGRVIGYISSGEDITEKKTLRDKLELSEKQFRMIFENAGDAIFWADADTGHIVKANRAAESLMEMPRESLLGMPQAALHPQDLREDFTAMFQQHIQQRGAADDAAVILTSSGKRVPVQISASITDIGGKGIIQGIFRDMTEHENQRLILEAEQNKSRVLLENTPAFMILLDQELRITYANGIFVNLFGEPENKTCYQVMAGRDTPCVDCGLCVSFTGQEQIVKEWTDSRGRTFIIHETTFTDTDGQIYALKSGVDISSVKQTQKQLEERSLFQQTLLETIPAPVFYKDRSGRYLGCNKAFEDFGGLARQDIIGRVVHETWDPSLADKYQEADNALFLNPVPQVYESQAVHSDGSLRDVVFHKNVFTDPDGSVSGLLGVILDITDRKSMELALARSEEQVRTLMENVPIGIFRNTPGADGVFVMANPALARMHGFDSPGQLLGTRVADLYAVPKKRKDLSELLAGAGLVQDHELQLRRRNGELFYASVTAHAVRDDDGAVRCFDGTITDVSERRCVQEKLRQAMDALEKSNRELEAFAYVASHDLKEPLRMVVSYMQLLQRRYQGQLDEKADKYIQYAVDGASRMQILITALLEYSRIGRKDSTLESLDCNALMVQIERDLRIAAKEVDGRITHDPLPTVTASPTLFARLLMNLSGNGLKYCNGCAPRVHVSAEQQAGEWVFSIRDNGIGIAPEHHERIFKIFHRLHTRDEYPGTGIGLAVCKKVVEFHGGRIWVESEPGAGATFRFTLPDITLQGAASCATTTA